MINIVIYARYSSQAQTEQSIEGQLRVCREFAENKGYRVINEYIDRAMTGTNDNRPEFQKMISDSAKRQFDYVLVYKLDRFSRSKYDNAIYKHKLQQNGVKVISATEVISDTPEGALMEGLLEMFAEMYSKDLSQKVKRGIKESIIKGNFIGGNILYGYKVGEDKKIYIDEEQAEAIRYIFEEYSKGMPKTEIVKNLNEKGFKTNKGKKFTKQSIQNTLSNRKYIGEYKSELIENNKYYPAIIDIKTFNKVQDRLQLNKRFSTKSKIDFMLSGKLYCGYCGSSIVGTSGTSHTGTTHAYYNCTNRIRTHNCKKKSENKIELENEIFERIYDKILDKNKIESIADSLIEAYNNTYTNKKVKELENKIKSIEKEFDKIASQILKVNNDSIIKRLNDQANDLTEQKEIYQKEMRKLKLTLSIKHTREDIINYLKIFLDQPKDDKFKQKLFDLFISAVYVFDDYLNIYLDIFDDGEKITLQEAQEHKEEAEKRFECKTQCSANINTIRTYTTNFVFVNGTFGIITKKFIR